jgi:hypothetical protein
MKVEFSVFAYACRCNRLKYYRNIHGLQFSLNLIVVQRGRSINQIDNDIIVKINTVGQENARCIIYIAGLCDMTKKVSHDFGTEICYFREKSSFCHIIREYQNFIYKLFGFLYKKNMP